jgi:uncharacterized membrane protein YkoI
MSQRTGLIIAVILTAFVLVVGGAVVGRTTQPEKPPAETAVVQQLMERESAYQDLARQANERLQQAYAKLQVQAQAQAQVQAQATATSSAFVFSPEQAANIALQLAPGAALLSVPELVNFQGVMAYKVSLNTGIVYIDANSGQVLYNGTKALVSAGPSNKGLVKSERNAGNDGGGNERGGEGGGGGEHEGGGGGD